MILRYVPFASVENYLRLGWEIVLPRSAHPIFDVYRVLMLWRCVCPVIEPKPPHKTNEAAE
jgi:hypothetical protein